MPHESANDSSDVPPDTLTGFTFSREFDFVRLEGLRRATGRPPHEWDFYILKELLDNALDADDAGNAAIHPRISVLMEYGGSPASTSRPLLIQVCNRALFPHGHLRDVFATQQYTSRKAFLKGVFRGALGNALKTILGIPYALRRYSTTDWTPALKPLVVTSGGFEFTPRYEVDLVGQRIILRLDQKSRTLGSGIGTEVKVGIDHYEQQVPRSMKDIQRLASQYRLCNPHAEFIWTVEVAGELWEAKYAPIAQFSERYVGPAPVHWYSPNAFQDLLGAVSRRQARTDGSITIDEIARCFAGFAEHNAVEARASVAAQFGFAEIRSKDIEGEPGFNLFVALRRCSSPLDPARLGHIGAAAVEAIWRESFELDGPVHYRRVVESTEQTTPFVLEMAMAALKEGRRTIWSALNFSPTYDDPFLRRWMKAPIALDQPVRGLRGLLDAYGITDDAPIVFFFHLACPTLEHGEFSKTDINHLPFNQAIGQLADDLVRAHDQYRDDQKLRIEQVVNNELAAILAELEPSERLVPNQIVERLLERLRANPLLAAWADGPDAARRVREFLDRDNQNAIMLDQNLAHSPVGTLSLPLHPNRHVDFDTEQLTESDLHRHHVTKVLYVQTPELEPAVLENNWLCRTDMALMRNPPRGVDLHQIVRAFFNAADRPLIVLRDADSAGDNLIRDLRNWLAEFGVSANRLIDAGLGPTGRLGPRLIQCTSSELYGHLLNQLEMARLPVKHVPSVQQFARDMGDRFQRHLSGHLWEAISRKLEVPQLLAELVQVLGPLPEATSGALLERLRHRLQEGDRASPYAVVADQLAEEVFTDFLTDHEVTVRSIVDAHVRRQKGGQQP